MHQASTDITSPGYWDDHWQKQPTARQLPSSHGIYGRRGYFMRMVRRHLPALQGRSVLEIGGGGGARRLLALAKWGGARAYTVDYSPIGIEQTVTLFRANGCEIETFTADVFEWDAQGQTFDVIVHWGVVEHFEDPTTVLAVCERLLAPGGQVLFSMPNMEAWGAALWRRWAPENWRHHIYHPDAFIRSTCARAGLDLTRVFHYGPPMLQGAAWERRGVLPALCRRASQALTALCWGLPVYSRGLRRVAGERGFLACRPGAAA